MELGMVFDGRAGDPNVIDEATRGMVAAFIEKRVGDMRCPDHGKAPIITCSGDSLENLSFEVTGCCPKIIALTQEKLSE